MSHVFVLDQDEAERWYTEVLGLEVSADMDLGPMRWLTVRVPGTTGRDILLELPGPPGMDQASDQASEQATRELVSKGATGFTFGLTTDDCHKTYETLTQRGVEFTDPPTRQPYGIDCGARDPFGTTSGSRSRSCHSRLVQPAS